jgi:hypothetical protein
VRAEVSLDPNKLMAELNRSSTRCLIWIKHKHGLYAQDFAKQEDFPWADLSHAYLVKADFWNAQCQGVSFKYAQCQGALDTLHPQNPPLDIVHPQNSPLDTVHP